VNGDASGDFVKFAPPLIGDEEIREVVDTLRSDWLTTGPKVRRFEREFADYVEAPAALALNSCTAGLHVALVALGIGRGDEVITTPLTFAASVNVIEHVGARPVLVDVEPETLNIDAERIEAAITSRTRCILPVHFAGHPAELAAIHEISARHGLAVVEDAAHAVAACYRGRPIGCGDNPTAFSFYATKNLTTGEGGMLTGSAEFVARARTLSLHGLSAEAWRRYEKGGTWRYEVLVPGFKYNMSDIQASLGIWQLKKLAGFQARREQIAQRYLESFGDCDALQVPSQRPHVRHAWHLFVMRLRPGILSIDRDEFLARLSHDIGTSVHFIPIHMHPYYRDTYGYRPEDFPVACENYARMFSLPLHAGLRDDEIDQVINRVLEVVATHRRLRRAA
jgi:dTDP-4-amino-4,6-dideoxygalactose transaminase